jgi:Ran GTPase-activating protein (RanGAP) involved in mRNA processing and transport
MAEHKAAVEALLTQKNDRVVWFGSFMKSKTQQLVVFGQHGRVYLMTPKKGSVNVDFNAHILDLRKIKSQSPNKFHASFANGNLEAEFECTDLINEMRQMFYTTFPGTEMFQCEVEPDSRLRELEEPSEKPCGGFIDAYICVCDWQSVPPRPDIIWEIENIYVPNKRRCLGLEEFESLKPQEFNSLVSTLAYNKYFTGLTCPNIQLDKVMAQSLGVMIAKNSTIEELNLNNTGLIKGNIAPICDAFKANKDSAIQLLDVSNNQLTDKDLPLLGVGLGSLPKGLISLNVSNCGSKKGGAAALINGLRKNLFMSGSVHNLNFSNNLFDNDGNQAIAAFLAQPNGLQVLSLVNCGIKLDQLFAALVRGCQSLEWLDISGNKMTKKDLSMMGQFLKAASHLKVLRMSNCGFDADSLKTVLADVSSNMYLNELDLCISENRIGAAGAKLLAPILRNATGIKKVDLSEMDFGPDGVQVICQSLGENNKLEHLDISGNFIGKVPFEAGVEALKQLINTEGSTLNSLVVRGGKTGPLRESVINFLMGMTKNETLTSLDVSDNHFGLRGTLALGKALQTNKKLTSLKWDGSDTPYQGFEHFARSLSTNHALKHMPLPVLDISNALRTNPVEMEPIVNAISTLITRNSNPEMMTTVFKDAGGAGSGGGGGGDTSFLFKGEAQQLKNLRNKVKSLGRTLEGMEQVVFEDAEGNELGIADVYQQRETAVLAMKQEMNEKLKNLAFDIIPVINSHMNKMQSNILSIVEKRYGSIDKETRSRLRLNMQFGAKDVDPEEIGKLIMESTASQIIRKAEDSYSSAISISSDYLYEKLMEGLQNIIEEVVVQAPPEISQPRNEPDYSFAEETPSEPMYSEKEREKENASAPVLSTPASLAPSKSTESVIPKPVEEKTPAALTRTTSGQPNNAVAAANAASATAAPPKIPKRFGAAPGAGTGSGTSSAPASAMPTPLASPGRGGLPGPITPGRAAGGGPAAGPGAAGPGPGPGGAGAGAGAAGAGAGAGTGAAGAGPSPGRGAPRGRGGARGGAGVAALAQNLFGAGGPPLPGAMPMPGMGGRGGGPPRRPPSDSYEADASSGATSTPVPRPAPKPRPKSQGKYKTLLLFQNHLFSS